MADGAARRPAVLLFTRDLRVDDLPALEAAVRAPRVLPLFVLDDRLLAARTTGPNRVAFLLESLRDLRSSLRARGGDLVVRRGDPAAVAVAACRATGAARLHLSADVTPAARRRRTDLAFRCAAAGVELCEHPGIAIVDPGALRPAGCDHYRVFTPFSRAWGAAPRRALAAPPDQLTIPDDLDPGALPSLEALALGEDTAGRRRFRPLAIGGRPTSPGRVRGGETAAWSRLERWCGVERYDEDADELAIDGTARIGAALHFGCISPLALERWAVGRHGERERPDSPGADAFVRQLCWRDFFLAVTRAFPAIGRSDYRPRSVSWRDDPDELAAWKEGRTGVELVDAAMSQLLREGFVHNRARLVAASYLVKTLGHHWREGADHFLYWLTDGDVASNSGNWQWMAGTGNDTRPNRVLNPLRQAARFDRNGEFRARYLAGSPSPGRLDLG